MLRGHGELFVTVREGRGKLLDRSIRQVDGETYDRNFIGHTLDELVEACEGLFAFVQEADDDGTGWHNYIFRRA